MEKRTSKEWNTEMTAAVNIKILDPDGWDRNNFQYSFFEKIIKKKKFKKKVMMSTKMGDIREKKEW